MRFPFAFHVCLGDLYNLFSPVPMECIVASFAIGENSDANTVSKSWRGSLLELPTKAANS